MAEPRIGRQTPTQSVVLPYESTKGAEAVELYNSTGQSAYEWQGRLIYDILAINEDGLWVHTKFGYEVPRRNGKGEILIMLELWALKEGLRVLHTAHRTTTSHSAWERLYEMVPKTGMMIASEYRALGHEHIFTENGGRVEFRTRTSKGGLGEGFDLLIIDEAQEYTDDQESALKYVVSDSDNPQTILCGTPPTAVSAGTIFEELRTHTLEGSAVDAGWSEWSVSKMTDPGDVEAWYETNPSLGTKLTERKIRAEIGTGEDDFNIQRLGLWLRHNQKSEISGPEWEALKVSRRPALEKDRFFGVKYGVDNANVALAVAARTKDGRIFAEVIGCRSVREGNAWLLPYLRNPHNRCIVADGVSGTEILTNEIKNAGIRKRPVILKTAEVVQANAGFRHLLDAGQFCHMGQPGLSYVASNCEKRAIGGNGGFGFRSLREDAEVALLDSVILACWACNEEMGKKKQKISC